MPPSVRIAVVDDHPMFVRGLELLLPEMSDGRIAVVASTGDAASAGGLVRRSLPDVALVDLHMPPPGGLRAVVAARQADERVRVLAMSSDPDPAAVLGALSAGASGFLPKSSEPADLLQVLLAAVDGWVVLPEVVLSALAGEDGRVVRRAPARAGRSRWRCRPMR
ncbi:response regulator [Actinoplanes sp. CA-142083]|uniref:response regulator n=1 Tax=Actinoplanes sp. CA-142083 TaxID=3239903 RepID=UPI003D8E200B